jgi:hypothetical protein
VNINKFKLYRYLGKALRGLEATMEGGRKHMEDSKTRRMHKKVFGMVLPKVRLHRKLKSIKNIWFLALKN